MLPVLLNLGFLKIYTYGVFLLLSFFWGSFFVWKNILLTSYKEDDVFDILFWSILGGLLFSRIEYILLHIEDFGFNIGKMILVNGFPGMGFFGFLIGFFLATYLASLSKKISYGKLVDSIVPAFLLALGIAKIGAFFSGSEVGSQTNFFLSLKYYGFDGARHLTPFYSSILYFLSSFLSFKVLRNIRRGNFFEGFNLIFFMFCVSLITLSLDFMRNFKSMLFGYSFDLILSSLILLTTSIYFIYYFRQSIKDFFSKIFSNIFKKKKIKKNSKK